MEGKEFNKHEDKIGEDIAKLWFFVYRIYKVKIPILRLCFSTAVKIFPLN